MIKENHAIRLIRTGQQGSNSR